MVDQSTCYNGNVFVDNVPLSFTPGGGNQTQTIPLNPTAMSWVGAQATAGAVTGIDSGSVSCSVVDGNLVCNYLDGQGCPPPFTGGQCPNTRYIVRWESNDVFGPASGSAAVWSPVGFRIDRLATGYSLFVTGTTESGEPAEVNVFSRGLGDPPDFTGFFARITETERVDGGVDDCGDPPGECGGSSVGSVQLTYTGCFPPEQPASDPPTEPPTPPLEPSSSAPSAPSPGSGEPGGGLPGYGPPRRVSGAHVYERTVTSNELPVNQDIPWYPVYGSEATSDPSFRFFLPPLFTIRDGVEPTLTPWNGIAVFVNAPGDTETGNAYRSVFATPAMSLNELGTNKRIGKFSVSLRNTNTSVWSQLDNADSSKLGEFKYPMDVSVSYITENVEAETAYSLYSFDELTYPYSVYELPDFVTFVEHFKGVGNRFQGAVWSQDENQWYLEGFQLQANTKGKRVKRNRRR